MSRQMYCVENKHTVMQGFTIIEWLVSFFITVLLITIVFQFLAQFYAGYIKRSVDNTLFTQSFVALDAIWRDISQAPCQKSLWDTMSENAVIWYDDQRKTKIGYLFEKQSVYFVTFTLRPGGRTRTPRKSLLANNIKAMKFIPTVAGDAVRSIHCCIDCGQKDIVYRFERVIPLENRVCYEKDKMRR